MDQKLTESGWKKIAADSKVKDNGLQKALAAYENLDEDKYDERLKGIATVCQLSTALKKAKEVAALKDVVKYLAGLTAAADAEKNEIAKAKASAAKTAAIAQKKAEDEAKKAESEDKAKEEEEDETGDSLTKLKNALKSLRTAKAPYFFLVCDAKPFGLVISKKDIRKSGQAKKELAELAGGATRPPKFGECRFEGSKLIFEMEKPPGGLARILQKWIKENTGLGLKVMVGAESAEDEDQPAEAQAAAGAAPGAKPAQAGAAANEKAEKLHKAAEAWHGTRKTVDAKVNELRKAIKAHYADGHPDVLKEIDKGLVKLDGVLDKLDHRLAESLAKAGDAANDAARQAELKNCKGVLKEYIAYVKSEPLIAHMDSNPFGVKTNLKQTLVEAVTHAAKTIG
jgi:hypothetical protein